ncbi:MAG: hypothetical protein GX326_02515, partial [Clostridiaceae bacterium]|nr:hypothetical protein [Clostridiaceae bacterium]
MLIYDSFPFMQDLKEKNNKQRAIALGFFDGVHLGHQELIKQVHRASKDMDIIPSIFTFQDHPGTKIKKRNNFSGLIQNSELRLETFAKLKIEEAFIAILDEKFRHISAEDFYFKILCNDLGVKALVVGQDAHFGYMGQGNIEKLKKWTNQTDVKLYVVP